MQVTLVGFLAISSGCHRRSSSNLTGLIGLMSIAVSIPCPRSFLAKLLSFLLHAHQFPIVGAYNFDQKMSSILIIEPNGIGNSMIDFSTTRTSPCEPGFVSWWSLEEGRVQKNLIPNLSLCIIKVISGAISRIF